MKMCMYQCTFTPSPPPLDPPQSACPTRNDKQEAKPLILHLPLRPIPDRDGCRRPIGASDQKWLSLMSWRHFWSSVLTRHILTSVLFGEDGGKEPVGSGWRKRRDWKGDRHWTIAWRVENRWDPHMKKQRGEKEIVPSGIDKNMGNPSRWTHNPYRRGQSGSTQEWTERVYTWMSRKSTQSDEQRLTHRVRKYIYSTKN